MSVLSMCHVPPAIAEYRHCKCHHHHHHRERLANVAAITWSAVAKKSAIQRRSGISATYSLSGWAEQKRNWDKHLLEKQMPFIPEIENLIKNLNLIHHLDSWKKVTSNQKWEKHLWGNRQLGRVRWTWKCGESQWHFDDLCRRNWYRLPGSLTSPDALIHQSPRTSWT